MIFLIVINIMCLFILYILVNILMCVVKRNNKNICMIKVRSMIFEYCLFNLLCKYRLLDNFLMSRKFKMCVYLVF